MPEGWQHLRRLEGFAGELAAGLAGQAEAQWWARALERQCHDQAEELAFLAPWLMLSPLPTEPGSEDFGTVGTEVKLLLVGNC